MSSIPNDAAAITRQLEQGLSRACASVRTAQVRAARRRAIERAGMAATIGAIATAVTVAISRHYGAGFGVAAVVAGVSLVACGGVIAWSLTASLRQQAPINEVAERLDLAAGDGNAIATALDLLHSGEQSIWADRAIADGVAAATSFGLVPPVMPMAAPLRRGGLISLTGGVVLIALAIFVPVRLLFPLNPADPIRVETSLTPKSDSQTALRPPPVVAKRLETAETPAAASASRASASPDRSRQNAGRSDEASASANSASPGESSASAGKAGGKSSTQQPPQKSNVGEPQAGSPSAAPVSDPKAMQAASFGSASSDAAQAKATPADGTGGDSADSRQSESKNDPGAAQGGSPSDSPSDKSAEGGGEGQGQSGKSGKEGQGSGQSMEASDGTGGNGQGSGQSPPKKSRGVAPLMLGSRQPDLLQGRQLPGPDERTKLQVPPRPTPESPSPDAVADARQKAEPAVSNYHVPASARRAVSQYFEQFHQDSDTASRQP